MFERNNIRSEALQNQKTIELNIRDLIKVLYLKEYTWVNLITKNSLKQEGYNMGHCVGQEKYWKNVQRGNTKIFSLRDSLTLSKSFVTIEYDISDKKVIQIQGKSNTIPDNYNEEIKNFLNFLFKSNYLIIEDSFEYINLYIIFNEDKREFEHLSMSNKLKPTCSNKLQNIIRKLVDMNPVINLNFIDVSKITNLSNMFKNSAFNGDISKWDISNVRIMSYMFKGSKFNGDISRWNLHKVKDISGLFSNSEFNGDISRWNTSNVINMSYAFKHSIFNGDISRWNVSKVRYTYEMFKHSKFNGDISRWKLNKRL